MRRIWYVFPVFALALAFASAIRPVPAMAGTSPALAQDTEVQMMQGELVKVDLENQTFTIKVENGEEVSFQFDSNTSVEGKDNGVQGLAGDAGTRLVVRYTENDGKKKASKIEIKKADG